MNKTDRQVTYIKNRERADMYQKHELKIGQINVLVKTNFNYKSDEDIVIRLEYNGNRSVSAIDNDTSKTAIPTIITNMVKHLLKDVEFDEQIDILSEFKSAPELQDLYELIGNLQIQGTEIKSHSQNVFKAYQNRSTDLGVTSALAKNEFFKELTPGQEVYVKHRDYKGPATIISIKDDYARLEKPDGSISRYPIKVLLPNESYNQDYVGDFPIHKYSW